MKIVSITVLEQSFVRYDLEIEDNHNFVVEGIVVHNSNWLAVYTGGQFHVKSRTLWKREFESRDHLNVKYFMDKGKTQEQAELLVANINSKPNPMSSFWKGLRDNEPLQKMLMDNPDTFVFGELFGNTARIKYNIKEGNRVAIFDIWKENKFFDCTKTLELARKYGVEHVPVLNEHATFDMDEAIALAEGKTGVVGAREGTIREGIVIKPLTELWDKSGRVVLKCPSPSFLAI